MADERTVGELSRAVDRLDSEKQSKESFDVWKLNIDRWTQEHDDRHNWLVRAMATLAFGVVGELLFLIIRSITDSGVTP